MAKQEKIYPFKGEKCSIFEIWKYYFEKGIQLRKEKLSSEIRKKATEVGIENLTEEMVEEIAFNVAKYKRRMSVLVPEYGNNCRKEFGEERWDKTIQDLNSNRRVTFRNEMKVATEDLKPIEKFENIELGVKENGRAR
jgi:hypothetical protein